MFIFLYYIYSHIVKDLIINLWVYARGVESYKFCVLSFFGLMFTLLLDSLVRYLKVRVFIQKHMISFRIIPIYLYSKILGCKNKDASFYIGSSIGSKRRFG